MAPLVVADRRAMEAVIDGRERLAQESAKHAGLCRMSADQRAELAAHCHAVSVFHKPNGSASDLREKL
jgi:hypothetical protein